MSGDRVKLSEQEIVRVCRLTLKAVELDEGHLAVQFVSPRRIQELNRAYRGSDRPTDVLSFPVDKSADVVGPRELGDIVICPEQTKDLREAIVHGVLHLAGLDHEQDAGEMLARQERIMAEL